jgi:hypothetical protein
MTLSRLISPALRSGLLIAAGSALIVGPAALELSVGAIVTGVAVGILTMALGIAGTDAQGRGTLSVAAQAVYDRLLALVLVAAALAFGFAGDRLALALFGALGLATLAVALTTRYTVRPAEDFL